MAGGDGGIPEATVLGIIGQEDEGVSQLQEPMLGSVGHNYGTQGDHLGGLLGVLEGRKRLLIKQTFQPWEAAAQGLGCQCFEQPNEYEVFDLDTGERILLVKEDSNFCERALCHPYHSAELHFYDTRFGISQGNIAMRVEKPFKCFCCSCCDICRHEAISKLPTGQRLSQSKVSWMGGGLAPKIEVMDRNGSVEGVISGPGCCLGGLVELCSNIEFNYTHFSDVRMAGTITKKRPDGMGATMREAIGQADTYVVEVPSYFSREQVAGFISSTILLDYLYFESGPPVSCDCGEGTCNIVCCNCYCCGCVVPCVCKLGGNKKHEGR